MTCGVSAGFRDGERCGRVTICVGCHGDNVRTGFDVSDFGEVDTFERDDDTGEEGCKFTFHFLDCRINIKPGSSVLGLHWILDASNGFHVHIQSGVDDVALGNEHLLCHGTPGCNVCGKVAHFRECLQGYLVSRKLSYKLTKPQGNSLKQY